MNTLEDAYIDIARQEENLLAKMKAKRSKNLNSN